MKRIVEYELTYPTVNANSDNDETRTIITAHNNAEILKVDIDKNSVCPIVWLLVDDNKPESKYEFLVLTIRNNRSRINMPDEYMYAGIAVNNHTRHHIFYKRI